MRALALALALLAGGAAAQDAGERPLFEVPSPVLTLDQDRLFAETRIGRAALAAFEEGAAALAEENAAIEADLIEEEQALTEDRADLTPEEFRDRADAFDAKVQQIRTEQDQKARGLSETRDRARQQFLNTVVSEVLSAIVVEKGALVVLNRRDVFLSAESIDITDEAIERINAAGE